MKVKSIIQVILAGVGIALLIASMIVAGVGRILLPITILYVLAVGCFIAIFVIEKLK